MTTKLNQTFGKAYKLCSKSLIDEIFESGETVKSYPLIVKYKSASLKSETSFQMLISAPKRTFKNAYQRNRIKRLCKEAIRKNKQILESFLSENDLQIGLCLIYSAKDEMTVDQLDKKTKKLFNKVIEDIHGRIKK